MLNTKALKKRIIDKNITGYELAYRCDVSQAKMSMVLNNKQSARLDLVFKIQEVLDIPDEYFAHYFLGGGQLS